MRYKQFKQAALQDKSSNSVDADYSNDAVKARENRSKKNSALQAKQAAPPQTLGQARIQHLRDKVEHAKEELQSEIAVQKLQASEKMLAAKRRQEQQQAMQAASRKRADTA